MSIFGLFYECSSVWKQDEILACRGQTYNNRTLLAITTKHDNAQKLEIHDQMGQLVSECKESFGTSAPCLLWHPTQPKLVALMSTEKDQRCIFVWEETGTRIIELSPSASRIQWASDGEKILIQDRQGSSDVLQIFDICDIECEGALQEFSVAEHIKDDIAMISNIAETDTLIIATKKRNLFSFNQSSWQAHELGSSEGDITHIFTWPSLHIMVLITKDNMLEKWILMESITSFEIRRSTQTKLSFPQECELQAETVMPGVLAVLGKGEATIQLWDILNDEVQILNLKDPAHMAAPGDFFVQITCSPKLKLLVAQTEKKRYCFFYFRHKINDESSESKIDWTIGPPLSSGHRVQSMHLIVSNTASKVRCLIALQSVKNATFLQGVHLHQAYGNRNAVLQTTMRKLIIYSSDPQRYTGVVNRAQNLKTNININGLAASNSKDCIAVWDGHQVECYERTSDVSWSRTVQYNSEVDLFAFCGDMFVEVVGSKILLRRQSIVTGKLSFQQGEGIPIHVHTSGNYILVVSESCIKIWELIVSEPTAVVPCKSFQRIHKILSAKLNADATVCSIIGKSRGDDFAKLFLYDIRRDRLYSHSFSSGAAEKKLTSHTWPESDRRVCIAELVDEDRNRFAQVLFLTDMNTFKEQEMLPICGTLIGLHVPDILSAQRVPEKNTVALPVPRVNFKRMRDFDGLGNLDANLVSNLMDFSFNLNMGNLDAAYGAIEQIESSNIWRNMAKICFQTERLEMGKVCIRNMQSVALSACMEEIKDEPQEIQIAMIAIEIGMIELAEKNFMEHGYYDRLVSLYCASNRWQEAIDLCESKNRIMLKNTHYNYGKYLDMHGDAKNAILNYLEAQAYDEVLRLLASSFESEKLLQGMSRDDSMPEEVLTDWGKFCESHGRFDEAIKLFQLASDHFNVVRLYVETGDLKKACEYEPKDRRCAYILGRHFDDHDDVEKAAKYYEEAKANGELFNLSVRHNRTDKLLQIATSSPHKNSRSRLNAAKYFENIGDYSNAIMLYQDCGQIQRAIHICFRAKLFEDLSNLLDKGIEEIDDPELIEKCAAFFMSSGHYEKAMKMYIGNNQQQLALELCMKHGVKLTEEMVQSLTPPRTSNKEEKKRRKALLVGLAKMLKQQGSFTLACKKFTQGHDLVNAVKCLIKANNKEKVIYYASKTKDKKVYVLAANFLQTLDWQKDDYGKTIIEFYTKAKAWELLLSFYNTYAQMEIDEYRDYDRALVVLKDAWNALENRKGVQIDTLQRQISAVEKFCVARKARNDETKMIKLCEELLSQPEEVEDIIRVGDVFALLIETYFERSLFQEAFRLIKSMKERKIQIEPYLDDTMVSRIFEETRALDPSLIGDTDAHSDEISEDLGSDPFEDA